jgi:hypothetical protein
MKHASKAVPIVAAMTLYLIFTIFTGPACAGVTDSAMPCVVFLTQEAGYGREVKFGTGFLLVREGRPCLVTASHVARDLGRDFTMVMAGEKGSPVRRALKGVRWTVSPTADAAFTGLPSGGREENRWMLLRAMPSEVLTARPLPPSREVTLVAYGYPLGLGVRDSVSPLSFESRAASGFITLERFDTHEDATFILLQNPSISGLSGGPVFDVGRPLVEGGKIVPRDGLSLVGLVSGVIWDKTGGKIAMIVPATEIARLLRSNDPRT